MFTMVVPGEGGGVGSIHVDIRGIMFIFENGDELFCF